MPGEGSEVVISQDRRSSLGRCLKDRSITGLGSRICDSENKAAIANLTILAQVAGHARSGGILLDEVCAMEDE